MMYIYNFIIVCTAMFGFKVPVIDQCLQAGSTPACGPLWISTGEPFKPQGVHDFLMTLITYAQSQLERADIYKVQIELSQKESTKDKVQIVKVREMKKVEKQKMLKVVCVMFTHYVFTITQLRNL